MKNLFSVNLNNEQEKKLNDWIEKLPHTYTGAIGGRLEYCITPTGLGLIIKVKDAVTKTELDLTDYNDW